MIGFALARLAGIADRSPRLFALATLTLWLLLPAYGLVVVAVLLRTRALLGVSVALVLLHGYWVAPDLRWWPRASPHVDGSAFVVAAANVRATNGRPSDVARALGDLDADVLALVEFTPDVRAALETSGVLDAYPHRIVDIRRPFFGTAIYSRFPLRNAEILSIVGYPMATASVDLPGGTATVVAVHTVQPLAGLKVLREQLRELDQIAHESSDPIILAGDFNATRQHAPFRALVDGGVHDAHLASGRGAARTWPSGRRLPPFALLDHVVVSEHFAVLDVDEAKMPGSDHRAVVAKLATAVDRS